jgi:pyrroline-5-carboxylate reductase
MKISVLGCGNMGSAIINGLKKVNPDCVIEVWDTIAEKAREIDSVKLKNPTDWFKDGKNEPDVVIIAVKPQVIKDALSVFNTSGEKTLWISIAAGVSIANLEKMLPSGAKIVRVMPNTPAIVGEACSLYSLNSQCSCDDKEKIEYIFNAVGISMEISENQMNAATGLSGSGPAFVYTIIEAFAEAGVAAGFSYDVALECAAKTILGSAKMVLETKEKPASLKAKVMSPGGTTAAGNLALEKNGVRKAVMSAVIAAAKRAKELDNIR